MISKTIWKFKKSLRIWLKKRCETLLIKSSKHSFLFLTLGTLIELESEVKSSSISAKTSPASLRKQVTVAEGEKASAAAIGAAVLSLTGKYIRQL